MPYKGKKGCTFQGTPSAKSGVMCCPSKVDKYVTEFWGKRLPKDHDTELAKMQAAVNGWNWTPYLWDSLDWNYSLAQPDPLPNASLRKGSGDTAYRTTCANGIWWACLESNE